MVLSPILLIKEFCRVSKSNTQKNVIPVRSDPFEWSLIFQVEQLMKRRGKKTGLQTESHRYRFAPTDKHPYVDVSFKVIFIGLNPIDVIAGKDLVRSEGN